MLCAAALLHGSHPGPFFDQMYVLVAAGAATIAAVKAIIPWVPWRAWPPAHTQRKPALLELHKAALVNCSNQQFGLWQRQVKPKIPDVVRQAELLAAAEQYRENQAAGSVLKDVIQRDMLGAPLNLLRQTAIFCMQGPRTVLVGSPFG